jgi:hypothetical protein
VAGSCKYGDEPSGSGAVDLVTFKIGGSNGDDNVDVGLLRCNTV